MSNFILREGLKKVKYLKGGEGSVIFCVLKFSIVNIKLGWEGGTRLQAENDVLAMGTVHALQGHCMCHENHTYQQQIKSGGGITTCGR